MQHQPQPYVAQWETHPKEETDRNPGNVSKDFHKRIPKLLTPLKLRDLTLKNRVVVSPMCQYSSKDGFFDDWHLVHLGTFAKGGAGLVFTEATSVTAEGRISPYDAGLWKDEHMPVLTRIVNFIHTQHAAAGIQLSHAGRKASTEVPFVTSARAGVEDEKGGWTPIAPSPTPYDEFMRAPAEMTKEQIKEVVSAFAEATIKADKIGFDVVEIHGAHGYLIHNFLSPLSNSRTDEYGGSFENRVRLCIEVIKSVRAVWPASKPLFLRISCSDEVDGQGWTLEDSIRLSALAKENGVDMIDCSTGGSSKKQKIKLGPCYQVPYAQEIRKRAGVSTCAVGMITHPLEAEEILNNERADLVALAREHLRNPFWTLSAATFFNVRVDYAPQYERARPSHL
eukprot:TRINITY_DN4066_c0_g2_i1.p1 TRINITY_DN4066_c0_g2~~TRINITY_DN4066_c0_g2_i1.p1  ORF type:complete len:395 (+),score=64.46 TRINITY_DN4066_c0_g2_i1:72-1256(+)